MTDDQVVPAETSVVDPYGFPEVPSIPDGDELFDKIMGLIEPELTSGNRDGLKEKYKDETPEDAKARTERYAKALAEYDVKLAEYFVILNQNMRAYGHQTTASLEKVDRSAEADSVSAIEDLMQQTSV